MGISDKENKRRSAGQQTVMSIIGSDPVDKEKAKKGRPEEKDREKKVRKSISVFNSIYEPATKVAYVERTNISELIENFLKSYVEQNQDKLLEYDRIKK